MRAIVVAVLCWACIQIPAAAASAAAEEDAPAAPVAPSPAAPSPAAPSQAVPSQAAPEGSSADEKPADGSAAQEPGKPGAGGDAAAAQAPAPTPSFTGQVAVVSDYVYRGVSYSNGHAAFQASGSWSNANGSVLTGLHIDGWFTTVDFGPGDPASVEMSGTLGYGGGSTVSYDIGATYIVYPGVAADRHYSYMEDYISLSTKIKTISLTATGSYSPAYSGNAGQPFFAELDAEMPVVEGIKLTAVAGYADLPRTAGVRYAFWGVGAEAEWHGFSFALRFAANNLPACGITCTDHVIASVAKSF